MQVADCGEVAVNTRDRKQASFPESWRTHCLSPALMTAVPCDMAQDDFQTTLSQILKT